MISLSDVEPALIESVGTKLKAVIADTVSTDLSISEKDAAKNTREETGDELILEVLEVYRDTRKESEAELTKINLPDTVFDQTPSSVIKLQVQCLKTRRRQWHPTPVFLPGESQGRQSLVGCCLWGRTELDTTEST